jgi:hypothetical protein
MMKKQQMEMSLPSPASCRSASAGRNRRSRAQWWFHQMRLVVDRADDWSASANATAPEPSSSGTRGR